ncbi:MAG: C39 family peptidase [Candidatus Bipolaricaulota bacterium]|nr:C39 family peptidase [Candidatus Bipolaricaulota bacterium]
MKPTKGLAILYVALVLVSVSVVLSLGQENITLPAPVPAFNQAYQGASGYWGDCGMGTNGCPDNVSVAGCLITSFAMVLGYYDVSLSIPREASCTGGARSGMDPGILNDWLKTHGGYGRCGSDTGSCCLEWTHLPPQVSITQYVNRSERGIDSTAKRVIDQSLRQGYPVICGVNWGGYCHGSTTQTEDCHWVVITGKKGATYTIIDPYNRNTTDPAGVSTTLDKGTFGAYTIDRYVIVSGVVPSPYLANLHLSLSFSPSGFIMPGALQVRSLTITGTEPTTQLLLYARVIDPHGEVTYAYYRTATDTKLHYAHEKRSLYPTPHSFSDGTFVLNRQTTAGEEPGTWTWEVWAEDPAYPRTPRDYEIAAYTISSSGAQAQTGIVIALALAIFIAGLIYVSILLR